MREEMSMVCLECGGDMVLSTEPLTEMYKGEEITVSGLEYFICSNCGEVVMSAEMADKQAREMARVYASRHALLSPAEITSLRKKLGLTQAQFESLIGVSRPTVCRWERGSSQQSETANILMRMIRDVPGAARYLMQIKEIAPRRGHAQSGAVEFTVVSGRKPLSQDKARVQSVELLKEM